MTRIADFMRRALLGSALVASLAHCSGTNSGPAAPTPGGAGSGPRGGSTSGGAMSASTGGAITGGGTSSGGAGGSSASSGLGGNPIGGAVGKGGAAGAAGASAAGATGFVHPGLLHSTEDFARMKSKVDAGAQPWKSGYDKLLANSHSALSWTARPVATVYRGADGTHPENYGQLYGDIAAAYASALRWKISGDTAYADKSIQILNAWSAVLTGIGGTSDKFLAAGLYGFQIANVAEIMRSYARWAAADFTRMKT